MKIIIFFLFSNHNESIDELCKNLNNNGFKASSFSPVTWRYRNETEKGKILWISFLSIFARIPGIRGLITRLFRDKALLKLSEKYDIIDIHFFSPIFDNIIKELHKRGKKIKVTIWGSDFYRVDKSRIEEQRKIYPLVDSIQIETQQIADDFLKVYPEFESKIGLAHFGILQFDIIDKLLAKAGQDHYKSELGLPADKLILTCGTNRSSGHQHLIILESIDKLNPDIKENLFLIFPMTYGGDKSYIEIVKHKAELTAIPFRILSSFLTMEDLGKYRIVSDLTLTVQVSDALASAIQEHLYTEEILIAGEWLPYEVLARNEIFYMTTALESVSETITEVVSNFPKLKNNCAGNKEKLSKFSSWNHVIKDWISIYNGI